MNKRWFWGIIPLLLVAYWFLPIRGQVILAPGGVTELSWPRFELKPASPLPGDVVTLEVTDVNPWVFVVLTVDGSPAQPLGQAVRRGDVWTWRWAFTVPETSGYAVRFYYDCHTGCVERSRWTLGDYAVATPPPLLPTKLGVVLPDPARDWRRRSGWGVEVVYARRAEEPYWGVDDLATRVAAHQAQGLRVIVRVDYDQGQSIPPVDNYVALTEYLEFLRRLARDARLRSVYGYVLGADYNTADSNALSVDHPVTPAWYARLFNGYGEDVLHSDNAVQIVRAENSQVRLIVGPLRPWSRDQDGALPYTIDAPWLNTMNTLVSLLDEGARAKAAVGIALAAPDGFDVQAPGMPDVAEMAGTLRSDEPRMDLRREAWGGARIGFGVYRDWLDIINAYPTTRGLPVYIISTNTYDREANIPPAQNYPKGWLTSALEVVNAEPQIVAMCWFLDNFPHSDQWDWFSLSQQPGRMVDASEEFDMLLQSP